MTDYKVYRFDGNSRIEMPEWINASDDYEAIRQAHQLGRHRTRCELWQRTRLVVALDQRDLTE